jgi:hypothetical protein
MTGLRAYRNKRDTVEKPLVDYMRKIGMSVYLMDKPCDALIGWRGSNHLVDFKSHSKTQKRGRLTVAQQDFNTDWRGSLITTLRTVDDVNAWRLAITQQEAVDALKINTRNRTVTT